MKLSDYIAMFLAEKGVTHTFGMSGGAAVHMFDSIARRDDINIISMTHEQCAAIAADGYARASGRMGVAISTSGPGATNLITGTCCSFYDSIPTLMLTGQVSRRRLRSSKKLRQFGFQETDVISIFKPITKWAEQLKNPEDIKYFLEKAFYIAFEGRPGPVLIDIPDDLQRAEIEVSSLIGFFPNKDIIYNELLIKNIDKFLKILTRSKRPLIILGGGIKTPHIDSNSFLEFIDRLNVPCLTTWAGLDLIAADHPLKIGTFGVYGSRSGNLAVQNADFILALGTRLSQNLTGGILSSFSREAKIVMVDIDENEMSKFKNKGIKIELAINSRVENFIKGLKNKLTEVENKNWENWLSKINYWKKLFPKEIQPKSTFKKNFVDASDFIFTLSNFVDKNSDIYVDTGGNLTWTCNSFLTKKGQRINSAWNFTPMGYSLPASIGAAFNSNRNIICIIGDGGLMVCLAELATVVKQRLPIKIFLLNNHGHGIQKQTLETWLSGNMVAVDEVSGLAFPSDWTITAKSFGLDTYQIDNNSSMRKTLSKVFISKRSAFVNVEINPDQKLYPVLKYGSPLEKQLPETDVDISKEMFVKSFDN